MAICKSQTGRRDYLSGEGTTMCAREGAFVLSTQAWQARPYNCQERRCEQRHGIRQVRPIMSHGRCDRAVLWRRRHDRDDEDREGRPNRSEGKGGAIMLFWKLRLG